MGRIFIVIAAVSFLMTAIAGSGVYYLSEVAVDKAKNDAIYGQVKGATQSISTRTLLLTKMLQNFAQSPGLITALQNSDFVRAKIIVQQMSAYFPNAMAVRLLFPTDTRPDATVIPHLGYADLDLVQNTFHKAQLPLIQGEKGKNRHLAITQGVMLDGKVIAVILASVSFKELQHSFNMLTDDNVYLELRQDDFVLFSHGNSALKDEEQHALVNINKTAWTISYWSDNSSDLGLLSVIFSLILIPAFITGFTCYICFRKLEALLVADQRAVLKATKDIIAGNIQGSYPVMMKEMNNFVSNIAQFKRTLEGNTIDSDNAFEDDSDLDSFFEESGNSVFLRSDYDTSSGFSASSGGNTKPEVDTATATAQVPKPSSRIGSAISLPEMGAQGISVEMEVPQGPAISSIFRAYDIRGIVDQTLTHEVMYDIGRAIGSEAVDKGIATIVIAKDGRTSSGTLSKELIEGLLSTGINLLDIGTVPTPVLYFVAHHHDDHSGVMLTGSHNSAEYNGVKIVLAGETLAEERIQAIKNRIDRHAFHETKPGTLTENSMFTNEYIGVITDDIRIARPMKVVVDAGNGVAGELGPIILKTLGCEVIELFCNIDGKFPNHSPDPSQAENLVDLQAAVKEHQADLGIAFDGDGDRMGVIDSNGKIIWPDRQMMFFSKYILAKKPESEVIYDVKCSRHLAAEIKKYGGHPVIWKTGHAFMKTMLKQMDAVFAGEMSGHLYFNDRWFGFDDGMYSAARLVEILSEDTRNSAEVFADFPDSPCTPEININLNEESISTIMQALLSEPGFADGKITDIDGLRVDFSDGFGLVRASNTTPSLVVRFEGDTEEALTRIQQQFRERLLKIKPDLTLPF